MAAQELAETMNTGFQAPDGGFYDTSDDHESLITRPRDLQDNATPSGNALAIPGLPKLAGPINEMRYVDVAHQALAQMQGTMAQYPRGFGQWLRALAYAFSNPREIAIVGHPDAADTQALLSVVRDGYRPFQVVALGSPDGGNAANGVGSVVGVPLPQDRVHVDGQATAYVCQAFGPPGARHRASQLARTTGTAMIVTEANRRRLRALRESGAPTACSRVTSIFTKLDVYKDPQALIIPGWHELNKRWFKSKIACGTAQKKQLSDQPHSQQCCRGKNVRHEDIETRHSDT